MLNHQISTFMYLYFVCSTSCKPLTKCIDVVSTKGGPEQCYSIVIYSSRVRPKHIRYRLSADNIGIGRNFGFAETENPVSVSVSVSADNLFQYRQPAEIGKLNLILVKNFTHIGFMAIFPRGFVNFFLQIKFSTNFFYTNWKNYMFCEDIFCQN